MYLPSRETMRSIVGVGRLRVPENISLHINEAGRGYWSLLTVWRRFCWRDLCHCVGVAHSVGSTVSRSLPVVIKFHVNSMHATRRVRGGAGGIARCECIESCIGEVHTRWIRASTIDWIVVNCVVFILEIHSLDVVDLHERRYDLSVSVCNRARWTR